MLRPALFALTIALLGAPAAWAQPEPDEEAIEEEASPEQRRRMQERIRMMRIYALTEALDLDEETAARLFPYLKTGDEELSRLQDQKREHRRALGRMARGVDPIDDKAVDRHVAALVDLEKRLIDLQKERFEGLDKILSAEQRLKFFFFQERFEREVRREIRQMQRRRRGEDGPPRERQGSP